VDTVGGNTLTDTITGLTNGTTYYFTVKAVNLTGTSTASNEANAIPATVPGAPTGLTATPAAGQVTLSWTAPGNNGGSAILGYNVYEGTKPGQESGTPVNGAPISGTTDTLTGLTNGQTYYFTVKAVNAIGSSNASNEASATPFTGGTVPGAPTITTATGGLGQVTLKWTAPGTGAPIVEYEIFEGTSAGGEGATPVDVVASNILTDTITGLGFQRYYFKVEAVNASGASPASNEANALSI
jgi:predicted phage tail protein